MLKGMKTAQQELKAWKLGGEVRIRRDWRLDVKVSRSAGFLPCHAAEILRAISWRAQLVHLPALLMEIES